MIPAKRDIIIRFGDIHEIFFRVRTKTWNGTAWVLGAYQDLTGWTVLCQVRETTESAVILGTYTVTLGDQGEPIAGLGAVYLKLSAATTGAITRTIAKGKYDIQLTNPAGDPQTYCEGDVTFTKDTSRV